MKRRSRLFGVVVACVVGLAVTLTATPAQATLGTQPAWSDFPLLEQGKYWNSTLVELWQVIVQSDVYTGQTCTQFVDGEFGSNTDTRTRNWQSTFNIGVDGLVGPQTWGTAQSHLHLDHTDYINTVSNGWGEKAWFYYYYYIGKRSSFYISYGTIDYYRDGAYAYTEDQPWQFQPCGQSWVTVSW